MRTPYKLHYFEVRNRAEPIRILLHYAGQPFEDVKYSFEQWPSVKPTMPLKTMSVLEMKEKTGDVLKLGQTTAILRHLGKKHGLEANTPAGQATCDMYGEQIQDYASSTQPWGFTFIGLAPSEQREELFSTKVQPAIDGVGELLSGQLKKNGNGYLVGSKVTALK
ncbi:CRE-GST-36 protein [Aphelenchoides avenae]|nr:CRE-GST-36 protein [Aphelenchus avenae]